MTVFAGYHYLVYFADLQGGSDCLLWWFDNILHINYKLIVLYSISWIWADFESKFDYIHF